MTDVHSPSIRSKNMRAIRASNTSPELRIRQILHRLGFRFRLHNKDLPSKPDIVLAKYKAIVLVHGCFWHGHDCHLFKLPKTRTEFWREKITSNRRRDQKQLKMLEELGYRVMIVWECALKGKSKLAENQLAVLLADWLTGARQSAELKGKEISNPNNIADFGN